MCVTSTAKVTSSPKPECCLDFAHWAESLERNTALQAALGFGMTVQDQSLALSWAHSTGWRAVCA